MLSYVSDHYSEGVSTVYTTTTAPIESPNSRPADQAATDAAQSPSVPVGVAGTGADAADAEVDDSIKEARQPDSDVGEDVRDDPVDAAESADAVETDDAVEDKNAPKADPRFVIHIVGNRFNLNNYW